MPKLFLCLIGILVLEPVAAQTCDRDCLRAMITDYLEAMLQHDPSRLAVTDDVRFTEDNVALSLGEGLWQSIESLGSFRQDILDVRNATAGVHVVAVEAGQPVLAAIRLEIDGNRIAGIESTVVRSREEGMIFRPEAVQTASPAMNVTPDPSQRNTREEMERLALLYPAGLEVGSFVQVDARFSPEAYRFENGQLMAGPGCTFIPGCDNIREQRLPVLAGIQARVAAVDEEQGIVWLRMNFGPGSVMRGAGELSVWELFKIYDGQIQAVEAFMEIVPSGTPFGWD